MEQTVMRAVDALPGELRTAITLREVEGLSYEEIAQRMDCPIGTVRSRIFRAREAIDTEIRPLMEVETGPERDARCRRATEPHPPTYTSHRPTNSTTPDTKTSVKGKNVSNQV